MPTDHDLATALPSASPPGTRACSVNRLWRLARRPVGDLADEDLTFHEEPVGELSDGEVLVRTIYLSLDPTHRTWMADQPGYLPAVELGATMRAMGIGRVEASRHPKAPVGALVSGRTGYQSLPTLRGDDLVVHDPDAPWTAEDHVGVLNHIGATAWFGVAEIAPPRAGETFVVSAAAGAVGSLAGQLARARGARVVGIASTPAKCRWLTEELGFDAAIDRKAEAIEAGLARTCPDGIDVYFDNVGGAILDACLARINLKARIALCGMISQYNATRPPPGPAHLGNLLIKRGRIEGFIVLDYIPRYREAFAALGPMLASGALRYKLDVVDGIEHAVSGLRRLFAGENTGKMVVRVG